MYKYNVVFYGIIIQYAYNGILLFHSININGILFSNEDAKDFVWITTNCGKFLKTWDYQTTLPASWEACIQVKSKQLELDMEQWTCSKLEKEYIKAVHCHPAYLTYMKGSTSYEMLGWMKLRLESRVMWEISITSDKQMTPP